MAYGEVLRPRAVDSDAIRPRGEERQPHTGDGKVVQPLVGRDTQQLGKVVVEVM